MKTTRPPYERRLTFEIRLAHADEALAALAKALHAATEDVALPEAIRTRAAIRAVYCAWDELDDAHRHAATMIALRCRGHQVLSLSLHDEKNEKLVRSVICKSREEIAAHVSTVALLAVLWKIADALDGIECADAA